MAQFLIGLLSAAGLAAALGGQARVDKPARTVSRLMLAAATAAAGKAHTALLDLWRGRAGAAVPRKVLPERSRWHTEPV